MIHLGLSEWPLSSFSGGAVPTHRGRKSKKERPATARPLAARCARVSATRPGCEAASLVHVCVAFQKGGGRKGRGQSGPPPLGRHYGSPEGGGQPFVLRSRPS